uniref:Uncharacterized protein n=1 Tax=Phytophthora ramorum TaxID=164328 RepID=H3GEU0_PHYRM
MAFMSPLWKKRRQRGEQVAAAANHLHPLALNQQDELLVVTDDVAHPIGECRFKTKGGLRGQNGVRDIIKKMQASDVPIDNSKHVLKAPKCVISSSKQTGELLLRRRRERLAQRRQAVADETELLRTHILENVLAQMLDQPELLKDLADELKLLRREDQREELLLKNFKHTLRARVRVRVKKHLQELKHAADENVVVFNCKHSLIQSTTFLSASELGYEEKCYVEEDGDEDGDEDAEADDEGCSSSASQSDLDLGEFMDADNIDVDFAAAHDGENDCPKLRVIQPDDEETDTIGEESSVSAGSFDSDSQASSFVKDNRRRAVSFGPLPLSGLVEENVVEKGMTLEERSDSGETEEVGDSNPPLSED